MCFKVYQEGQLEAVRRWPSVERTITIDNTLSLLNMLTVLFIYLLNLFDASRYKIKWRILSVKLIKGELWRSHGYIASYEMWVLLRLVRIYLNGFWIIINIQLFEIQVSTSITDKKTMESIDDSCQVLFEKSPILHICFIYWTADLKWTELRS